MNTAETDLHEKLARITVLAESLVARNTELQAEVDDLRDHIEGLNTKLTARRAETFTLNQEAEPIQHLLADAADRDTERLERMRALLEEYLSEVHTRLAPLSHGHEQN
ncbi:MAG: hypothetical protein AB8F78_08585 [Saprospiraceae bacterium]